VTVESLLGANSGRFSDRNLEIDCENIVVHKALFHVHQRLRSARMKKTAGRLAIQQLFVMKNS